MSDSIYSSKDFFNNAEISPKDKLVMLGILNHGNVNFFRKGSEETILINYFNPDRTTKGVVAVTNGVNDSMGKNNCRVCVNIIGKDNELGEIFSGLSENNINISDEKILAKIAEITASNMSSEGAHGILKKFIEPNLDKFGEDLKKNYPGVVNDEVLNTLKDNYEKAIDDSKKKQSLAAEMKN